MSQKQYLDLAREAYHAENYAESLRLYEYFFDHALDDDPASLYGVRLSYCLNEWARLGERYPEARVRLEKKAEESLSLLHVTRNPERFHDYVAITKYLKRPGFAVERFLYYHANDRELSATIIRFVWEKLVSGKHWAVCAHYLSDSRASYDLALRKYDDATSVSKDNPQFGGEEFDEQIRGWYVKDVTNILLVLINSGRMAEADAVRQAAVSDMAARGQDDVVEKIRYVGL